MKVVHTNGRKSLPAGKWVKAEASQGVSNCVATRLAEGAVSVGDTQTDHVIGAVPAGAWASLIAAVA